MLTRKVNILQIICSLIVIFTLVRVAHGQGLSQAHEQEFMDVKTAIQAAQTAKADKYAPDEMKKAREFLSEAEDARLAKDDVQFSQASHMARALAEYATTLTELRIAQEKLSATRVELEKIRAEIKRLEKAN